MKLSCAAKYRDTKCISFIYCIIFLFHGLLIGKESKLKFKLNNSVAQIDFCDGVTLEKNIFDDYVVTLKFVTYTDYQRWSPIYTSFFF